MANHSRNFHDMSRMDGGISRGRWIDWERKIDGSTMNEVETHYITYPLTDEEHTSATSVTTARNDSSPPFVVSSDCEEKQRLLQSLGSQWADPVDDSHCRSSTPPEATSVSQGKVRLDILSIVASKLAKIAAKERNTVEEKKKGRSRKKGRKVSTLETSESKAPQGAQARRKNKDNHEIGESSSQTDMRNGAPQYPSHILLQPMESRLPLKPASMRATAAKRSLGSAKATRDILTKTAAKEKDDLKVSSTNRIAARRVSDSEGIAAKGRPSDECEALYSKGSNDITAETSRVFDEVSISPGISEESCSSLQAPMNHFPSFGKKSAPSLESVAVPSPCSSIEIIPKSEEGSPTNDERTDGKSNTEVMRTYCATTEMLGKDIETTKLDNEKSAAPRQPVIASQNYVSKNGGCGSLNVPPRKIQNIHEIKSSNLLVDSSSSVLTTLVNGLGQSGEVISNGANTEKQPSLENSELSTIAAPQTAASLQSEPKTIQSEKLVQVENKANTNEASTMKDPVFEMLMKKSRPKKATKLRPAKHAVCNKSDFAKPIVIKVKKTDKSENKTKSNFIGPTTIMIKKNGESANEVVCDESNGNLKSSETTPAEQESAPCLKSSLKKSRGVDVVRSKQNEAEDKASTGQGIKSEKVGAKKDLVLSVATKQFAPAKIPQTAKDDTKETSNAKTNLQPEKKIKSAKKKLKENVKSLPKKKSDDTVPKHPKPKPPKSGKQFTKSAEEIEMKLKSPARKTENVPDPIFRVGSRVAVYWPADDSHYSGEVIRVTRKGDKFLVKYDDGYESWERSHIEPEDAVFICPRSGSSHMKGSAAIESEENEIHRISRKRKRSADLSGEKSASQTIKKRQRPPKTSLLRQKSEGGSETMENGRLRMESASVQRIEDSLRAYAIERPKMNTTVDEIASGLSQDDKVKQSYGRKSVREPPSVDLATKSTFESEAEMPIIKQPANVGSRVAVYFDGDGKFFAGDVIRIEIDKKKTKLYVAYDEGGREWVPIDSPDLRTLRRETRTNDYDPIEKSHAIRREPPKVEAEKNVTQSNSNMRKEANKNTPSRPGKDCEGKNLHQSKSEMSVSMEADNDVLTSLNLENVCEEKKPCQSKCNLSVRKEANEEEVLDSLSPENDCKEKNSSRSKSDMVLSKEASKDISTSLSPEDGETTKLGVGSKVAVTTEYHHENIGEVTRVNRRGNQYYISYDDGEKEWVAAENVKRMISCAISHDVKPIPRHPDEMSVKNKALIEGCSHEDTRGLVSNIVKQTKRHSGHGNDPVAIPDKNDRSKSINFYTGCRVAVYWGGDDKYYHGQVTRMNTKRTRIYIIYDDGEEEWLPIDSEDICLLDSRLASTRSKDVAGRSRKRACRLSMSEPDDFICPSKYSTGGSSNDPSSVALRGRATKLAVGTKVGVYWKGDDEFYNGTVDRIDQKKAQVFIRYDDGEEEWLPIHSMDIKILEGHSRVRKCYNDAKHSKLDKDSSKNSLSACTKRDSENALLKYINLGDRVSVFCPADSEWYDGTVTRVGANRGRIRVAYDDGFEEFVFLETTNVRLVLLISSPPEIVIGCRVAVYWDDDDAYYVGAVTCANRGQIFVEYDDGDQEWVKLSSSKVKLMANTNKIEVGKIKAGSRISIRSKGKFARATVVEIRTGLMPHILEYENGKEERTNLARCEFKIESL